MLKIIAGLVAGLAVALASIYVIWLIGLQIYPLPQESGAVSLESEGALIQSMPTGAQAFIVLAWFGGAYLGALTATHISRRYWPGWIIAGFVACVAIANIVMFPHPEWMQIGAVVVPIVGGLLASHWARRSFRAPLLADVPADA
jgi:hypothetical protein